MFWRTIGKLICCYYLGLFEYINDGRAAVYECSGLKDENSMEVPMSCMELENFTICIVYNYCDTAIIITDSTLISEHALKRGVASLKWSL